MNTREPKVNTFQKLGRYLYADYTPLEQNINVLSQLKDFISLLDIIFQAQNDFEFLRMVLANAESLESEIVSKIDQLSNALGNTFGNFSNSYNESLRERYSLPSQADPFVIASSSLKSSIVQSREIFLKQSDNYRRYVYSRIEQSLSNALEPLNNLASKDYEKLPYVMTSNFRKGLQISIDHTIGDNKHYNILLTNTLPLIGSSTNENTNSISNSLSIRSIDLEFWNERRKVSDFGLKDIMIPVGLRTPITKKLKKSLDFLPGLDIDVQNQREPKFVNTENYYVYSVTSDGRENLLAVLVDDPSTPDVKFIRIKYGMSETSHGDVNNTTIRASSSENPRTLDLDNNKLPKIDVASSEEGEVQDVLGIKGIFEATDISQIMLLGRAIFDKVQIISNYEPSQLAAYSKLSSIRVDDKDALVVDASKSSISLGNTNIIAYDPSLVTLFLEITAKYYAPMIKKLKEKSPMKNELILRFENADGSREEHSLKIEELNSILKRTEGGKKIAIALEIYNDENSNKITNNKDTTRSTS
jgi:hypothetical protein